MNNKEVAITILNQMGGNKFVVMTGSKDFVNLGNGLRMTLSRNFSKANRLDVTLNGDDTYTMRFYRYSPCHLNKKTFEWVGDKTVEVRKFEHIYFDQLQELFTEVTHMYTKLF